MQRFSRHDRTLALAAAVGLTVFFGGLGDALADNSIKSQRITFEVELAAAPDPDTGYVDDVDTYEIAAWVFYKGSYKRNAPVQLLVHGASYDHTYWDAPSVNGQDYSYARHMAAEKYTVIAIDQIGAGESDKPAEFPGLNGYTLGLDQSADSVVQIVHQLRTADNPLGTAFDDIALVGHSNGSVTSIKAQANGAGADVLVVTGWQHTVIDLGIDPAALEPLFANPYFEAPCDIRGGLFYLFGVTPEPACNIVATSPFADPDVVALDLAQLVSTIAVQQFVDLFVFATNFPVQTTEADQVPGDVYIQLGQFDVIAPAYLPDGSGGLVPNLDEANVYASADSVTIDLIDGITHAFNTNHARHASWDGIDAWLDAAF